VPEDGVALSWRTRNKPQPPNTKFPVPPVDAPNVKGARDMGFPLSAAADGTADLSKLRKDVEQGRVSALYVFDPGPAGSIGDLSWVADARKAGKLPLLIVQASARALPTRGDAQEDWQILVNLGSALGVTLEYTASAQIRGDIAAAMASNSAYAGLANLSFARPVAARHWLQASNPSERWKWDVMFQDLPPVKFSGRPEATSIPGAIPLQRVD
jgi:hypothetical protein